MQTHHVWVGKADHAYNARWSNASWTVLWYFKISAVCSVCKTIHVNTVYIVAAHLQLVWYDVHTHVRAHTLNLCRSKSEDKLLNPAAPKLSTCARDHQSWGYRIPRKCRTLTPTFCAAGGFLFFLTAWRMMPWTCSVLFALPCHQKGQAAVWWLLPSLWKGDRYSNQDATYGAF